jgi:hypothetical protein
LAYPWSALKYSEVRMKYGIFAFFPWIELFSQVED